MGYDFYLNPPEDDEKRKAKAQLIAGVDQYAVAAMELIRSLTAFEIETLIAECNRLMDKTSALAIIAAFAKYGIGRALMAEHVEKGGE